MVSSSSGSPPYTPTPPPKPCMQVVEESAWDLYDGFVEHKLPTIDAGLIMYLVLGSATVLKALCYVQCSALSGESRLYGLTHCCGRGIVFGDCWASPAGGFVPLFWGGGVLSSVIARTWPPVPHWEGLGLTHLTAFSPPPDA